MAQAWEEALGRAKAPASAWASGESWEAAWGGASGHASEQEWALVRARERVAR